MAETMQKIISVTLKADQAIEGIQRLNQGIEKNNSVVSQNTAEIKALQKELEKEGADTQTLKARIRDLNNENEAYNNSTKELQRNKRELQKEVQNEIRQQRELDGSLRQLRAELSNLTKEYDSLGREEREVGNRGAELKAKINAVTTEIKNAEFATQRYYRNVGNYENAILSAIGMNGRFGQSLINITNISSTSTTSITQMFSSMGTSIKAFGKTLMGLMANPAFLAIAGIAGAGMAFKWFYDYNEGLAEATRLTREFTGLGGDELVALRNKIQATADTMGKDFKETLQTADSLMAHFHITGEEAMTIINKGFASGADVNGDMLQKVQQLAPAFHDAGISADEMMAIISQTKSGIFSDQGLEAIKQGSARIREMSATTQKALEGIGIDAKKMEQQLRAGQISTFDAVKQVSAALKQLPDNAQEVGEAMTAVFGRQGKFASQEMIESLATMSTSLDEVTAKTGEYGELLLENINTEEELNNVTAALFDVTDKGWEEAKQQATIYAKKALVAVVKGVIDVINWFVRMYNQSLAVRAGVQYIVLGFKQLWAAAKFVIGTIITGFKNIGRMLEAWVKAFNIAWQAIKNVAEGIAGIFRGIANLSPDEVMASIGKVGNAIKSGATDIYNAFADSWKQGINDLKGNFSDFVSESVDNVKGMVKNINGTLSEVRTPAALAGGGDLIGASNTTTTTTNNSPSGGSKAGKAGKGSKAGKNAVDNLKKLADDLQNEADALSQKAAQAEAKISEESIKAYYAQLEQQLREKYKLLGAKLDDLTTAEGRAFKVLLDANQEAEEKALQDFRAKQKAEQEKQAVALIKNQLETATKGSKEWLDLRLQQLTHEKDAELAAITNNEELRQSVIRKYAQKEADVRKEYSDLQLAEAKRKNDETIKLLQTQLQGIDEQTGDLQKRYDIQLELLRLQKDEELRLYEGNEAIKQAILAKYQLQEEQLQQEHTNKVIELNKTKYEAIASVAGGLGQIMGEFGEESKEAAVASKILALGEIMVSQAVAIANAVKAGSNATNPFQMIAQIAASVTAVTVAMVQAFKSLNQAKFATGGYVRGAGTGTSDSIPVRVSNGESVINANTTAMFSGLLSSLNQLGGGVPIQATTTAQSVQGEDMLARAFARGVAMLPAPVVSVEDINRGQRQVEVMNERATL